MSINAISITCDRCGIIGEFGAKSVFATEARARRKDWKTGNGNHICPKCNAPAAPGSVPQAPKKEKQQMTEVKIGPWLVAYDEEAGAGYLYLFPEKRGTGCVEETVEAHTGINIDFTEDGTPLGIEVFGIFKRGVPQAEPPK